MHIEGLVEGFLGRRRASLQGRGRQKEDIRSRTIASDVVLQGPVPLPWLRRGIFISMFDY